MMTRCQIHPHDGLCINCGASEHSKKPHCAETEASYTRDLKEARLDLRDTTIAALRAKLAAATDSLFAKSHAQLEAEIADFRAQLSEATGCVSGFSKQIDEQGEVITQLTDEKASLEAQNTENLNQLLKQWKQIEDLESKLTDMTRDRDNQKTDASAYWECDRNSRIKIEQLEREKTELMGERATCTTHVYQIQKHKQDAADLEAALALLERAPSYNGWADWLADRDTFVLKIRGGK